MAKKTAIINALKSSGATCTDHELSRVFLAIRYASLAQGAERSMRHGKERIEEYDLPNADVALFFQTALRLIAPKDNIALHLRQKGITEKTIYDTLETFMTRKEYLDLILSKDE